MPSWIAWFITLTASIWSVNRKGKRARLYACRPVVYNDVASAAELFLWTVKTGMGGRHKSDSVDDFTGIRTPDLQGRSRCLWPALHTEGDVAQVAPVRGDAIHRNVSSIVRAPPDHGVKARTGALLPFIGARCQTRKSVRAKARAHAKSQESKISQQLTDPAPTRPQQRM